MRQRKILYLSPDRARVQALATHLSESLFTAEDPGTAARLISGHRFQLGIAELENWQDPVLRELEHNIWGNGSAMEWIALLSPASLQNANVRHLIAESFFDYHTLPADIHRLLTIIGHACGMAEIRRTVLNQQRRDAANYNIVGVSAAMRTVFESIAKIVRVDFPVLITGQSGTGKELAAIAIHQHSARLDGPFICVNCAALPATLIQSELFGYEKGAFTGAVQSKKGYIERACGGTLFLDEIGDLSLDLQSNLLRFLQCRTIQRVGGNEEIPVDVRIISATHVDLQDAVEQGRFRDDLYFRLNVLKLDMPSLSERPEDVEVLAQHFFKAFKKEHVSNVRGFSRKALQALSAHEWPGNVRELQNRIHRAVTMCDNRWITPADMGLKKHAVGAGELKLKAARDRAEKQAIEHALARSRYQIAPTARSLGISHVSLYRLLKKHSINARDFPVQGKARL
jgi:DNA-binding NtrC family response regulator